MMRMIRPLSLALALTSLLTAGTQLEAQDAPAAAESAQALPAQAQAIAEIQAVPRIVGRIDASQLTPLRGSRPPLARTMYDRGQVHADLQMGDLFLVLRRAPEVQQAFDSFVASEYDPTSPNFHQWLTADQIGERFGPAAADVEALTYWLRSQGFNVDEVSKDRVSIRFSGSAEQVQAAFHTEIHSLDVKGTSHLANITGALIPSALVPVVTGVRGLHNFFPRPLHRLGQRVVRNADTGKWERTSGTPAMESLNPMLAPMTRPKPLFGTTDTYGDAIEDVAPYDFATIYNVLPLWQQTTPVDGTGQTIAIAGTSNIVLADVAAFRTTFGLPTSAAANTPKVIVTNSDPGACTNFADTCSGDLIENTLDVEWSGAVAKGASIVLVTSSATTASTDPLYLSESYIVQNKTASIMNVSYGECELLLGDAGNTQYSNLWQTAAAEGISVFVASGDGGSPACDQGFDAVDGVPYAAQFGLAVNGLASTVYNTAVGGTDLNWGSSAATYWSTTNSATNQSNAAGYIPEVPWNSTCTNPLIFSTLASDASFIGAAAVTDAESACNFVVNNFSSINTNYGVQLAGLVDDVGGGGGKSNCTAGDGSDPSSCTTGYSKPTWQAGVAGIPTDGRRDIPDVSFFASNGFLGSSYLICVSGGGNACVYSATAEPSAQEVGGTSVASPAMAGVMALINQKAGAAQGNPNPTLYSLAATQTYSACSSESAKASGACLFNDIDTGTIAMACLNGSLYCTTATSTDAAGVLTGFAAGVGYDLATGLGSLNVSNVVKKWPVSSAPIVTLSPTSLAFPSTVVGVASAVKTVTLSDTGKSALSLTGFSFTGTNASSFSQTNTCPTSLAAAASCTISITFKPTLAGSLAASLSIADNAYDSPQTVAVTGTATASAPSAAFSATSIAFGSTVVGATNTATVKLSNAGTAALALTSISITGTNATSFSETNACGTSLAAGGSCVVTVTFKPTVAGSLTATLKAVDNAGNSPQSVALSGTATAVPSTLSFTPTSLTFASTILGTTTAAQVITIKNTGTTTATFSAASAITGTNATSFLISATTCSTTLAAGASCTNSVEFKPTVAGALTAAVTYKDNATGGTQTVTLKGTGLAVPTLSFTPASLTFASTILGNTTAAQVITIKNTGTTTATFSAASVITGTNATSFLLTATTCSTTLAAGASCTNSVEFKPTVAGALTAVVTYKDNATGGTQTVALKGTGLAVPTLSFTPASLTFASTILGNTTAAQVITIKNTGTTTATFSAASAITGTNAKSFLLTATTCSTTLAGGASCTNSIEFKPTVAGALTAAVTYKDNATGGTQTVALKGTGLAVPNLSFTPTSLTFASTILGSTTAAQVITVKNTGTTTATFSAASAITGTNATSFSLSATTCSTTLAVGASCTNSIKFKPTVAGALTAAVTFKDNATGGTQTVTLKGTGLAVPTLSFTPTTLSFASTILGSTTSAQVITIKNTGTTTATFSAASAITGTNATSFLLTATTCSTTLAGGASCTNSVEFKPTVAGALTAAVTYKDNATGGTQTVTLKGTGLAVPTLSFTPTTLTFASTILGSTTAAQVITIKNTGTTTATFSAASTITGTNATSFLLTATTCSTTLAGGASCTNSVEFKPTVAGALTAAVTYKDNATGGTQTVALKGTGLAVPTLSFTPTSLTFASTTVGTATAAQVITIKNTGTTTATFSAASSITGTNATSFLITATTCSTTLAAGASCTNSVEFKPTVAGALAAAVTYKDNATGGTQTVTLKGTGK